MDKESSVLSALIEELKVRPEGTIELLNAMSNVVRPWEAVKMEGQAVVNSYRRISAMGEEVGLIESSAPTWILAIEGKRFTGDKVFNRKGAEREAQGLLDAQLRERGFILMDPQDV